MSMLTFYGNSITSIQTALTKSFTIHFVMSGKQRTFISAKEIGLTHTHSYACEIYGKQSLPVLQTILPSFAVTLER